MGRQEYEYYARILLLFKEGGLFIAREILKRETQKHEGNLNEYLRNHNEQLKRRFTEKQINEILPIFGGAQPDDWDIVLLTGVLLEVFRTTLTSREKRELLVLRNVRDELLTHIESASLDEETFEDLKIQLEEALTNLSAGLEPALVANCQRIVKRYLYEPIHMPSSLDHLENMCKEDEDFVEVVKTLRKATRTVIDDIIDIVRKAEDEGRELKAPKVVEYIIKPECKHREILECVESALDDVTDDDVRTNEGQLDYAKVKNDLEDLLEEIKENGDVYAKYEKGKGLVIRVECKTYATLLNVFAYMDSQPCVDQLDMIASAIKEHFGTHERVFLACTFIEETMQTLYEAIKTENVEYSRSISLSMKVNTIQGLAHVWDMFEGGGAQNHLNQIAEALSEYLGSKITLKASLDVTKFKEALEEAVEEMDREDEAKEGTETDQEKTKMKDGEETESADTTEGGEPGADVAQVAVPRRGVEIVAVKAGTRKTTLFDETISEGERDEISEMGFDTRVDGQNRGRAATLEEPGNDAESESKITEIENEPEVATPKEDGKDDRANMESTADKASNDSRFGASTEQVSQEKPQVPLPDKTNEVLPSDPKTELPNEMHQPDSTTDRASHVSKSDASADQTSHERTSNSTSGQESDVRQSDASANSAREERPRARQAARIPSEEIPDAVRGAVRNFYRDMVYMTSRTDESSAGTEAQETPENRTPSVTEVDAVPHEQKSTTRPREDKQLHKGVPPSVPKEDEPGARNMQQIDLSLRLSSALDAIGVNQEVLDQRQARIQTSEAIMNQMAKLSERRVVVCHFGSHAEGTAMVGLPSNLDTIVVLEDFTALQNTYSLEQPSRFGKTILADDTRPGFMHLPLTDEMYRAITNESTLLCLSESSHGGHGASAGVKEEHCGFGAETVLALRMSAWPIAMKRALQQRAVVWAFDASSEDLTNQPMTLVPYNSCAFRDDEMEWRISTAHVERVLMNSLTIHQRRVFILFRIIMKYLVNPKMSKPLTSYMIKNIFFHMAANTWPEMWNEASLVLCLNGCINKTRQFLRANNLPNFFIQKENLIYGRLTLADRSRAEEILLTISDRPYASIASIQDGNVGSLIDIQSSRSLDQARANTVNRVCTYLNSMKYDTCMQVIAYKDFLLEWIVDRSTDETSAIGNHFEILKFLKNYISKTLDAKSNLAAEMASKYISTSLASHLVCLALKTGDTTVRDWYLIAATMHFHKGMESDALSSRMKFLSALVSLNQLTSAREMLVDIEVSDEVDAHAICACRKSRGGGNLYIPDKPSRREKRKENLMRNMCSCVTFLPTESLITPCAVTYERHHSTTRVYERNPYNFQSLRYRKWAVVDAKVYFGYLNVVLYESIEDLKMYEGKADVNHKESLMNFLGLYSEYIGDFDKAAAYYKESIDHAPAQNAAQWYIALLLFRIWIRKTLAQSMIEYHTMGN